MLAYGVTMETTQHSRGAPSGNHHACSYSCAHDKSPDGSLGSPCLPTPSCNDRPQPTWFPIPCLGPGWLQSPAAVHTPLASTAPASAATWLCSNTIYLLAVATPSTREGSPACSSWAWRSRPSRHLIPHPHVQLSPGGHCQAACS